MKNHTVASPGRIPGHAHQRNHNTRDFHLEVAANLVPLLPPTNVGNEIEVPQSILPLPQIVDVVDDRLIINIQHLPHRITIITPEIIVDSEVYRLVRHTAPTQHRVQYIDCPLFLLIIQPTLLNYPPEVLTIRARTEKTITSPTVKISGLTPPRNGQVICPRLHPLR